MAFNMSDFFNAETRNAIKSDWKPVRISVHKLHPAAGKTNFYHIDDNEIAEIARTIELIGIQQYPVVKPLEGTDGYEIIAGHKRRLAVLRLLSEGKMEYEMIPCKVEMAEDSIKNRLILIFTNSTQRERTDFEKMQEIREVRDLLTDWKKDNSLPGKMQNAIAEILGTSKTKIGTLENIDRNLIPAFRAEFEQGNISTTAANEIAGLEPEAQQALYTTFEDTGSLTAQEARELKEDAQTEDTQVEGQRDIYMYPEYLPDDTDTREQEPQAESQLEESYNSGETEKEADIPVASFAVEPETSVTYNQLPLDTTDRKSLIVNGRINNNKEYGGMSVKYFMDAVTCSDLFSTDFWGDWRKSLDADRKQNCLTGYAGLTASFTTRLAEPEICGALLTDTGLSVTRMKAGQQALIQYADFTDLIDAMIQTRVIEFRTDGTDLHSWAAQAVRELSLVSDYLTEDEIYVLQDFAVRGKERKEITGGQYGR